MHHGEVLFDTGLSLRIPQEYILIPLDIFKQNMQNKAISNRKEAWLSFLSFDEPERVIEIVEGYPDFKAMYEEIYWICQNVERVMEMFSKELLEMDRNTVQYMIEEQQEQIEAQQEQLEEKDIQLEVQQEQLGKKDEQLEKKEEQLTKKDELLEVEQEEVR